MAEGGFLTLKSANDDDENREPFLHIRNDEDSLILRIIAKTKMDTGFCYLALDQTNDRILRPLLKNFPGKCCWPKQVLELELDNFYNFRVIAHPDRNNYCTPFPHCKEDLIVDNLEKESIQPPIHFPLLPESDSQYLFEPKVGTTMSFLQCIEEIREPELENGIASLLSPKHALLSKLVNLAKFDVQDIFGPDVIKENSYVDVNTHCCSAGILRSSANLEYDEDKEKYYCKVECVSGTYNMPVKVLDIGDIDTNDIKYPDALIVLGLGHPFKGSQRIFDPARCYLLVVGIYPLPNQNGQPLNQ